VQRILLDLKKVLPPLWLWAGLGLGGLLGLAGLRRRPTGVYLTQVLIMGLGAMALEVIILILCQIHLGCSIGRWACSSPRSWRAWGPEAPGECAWPHRGGPRRWRWPPARGAGFSGPAPGPGPAAPGRFRLPAPRACPADCLPGHPVWRRICRGRRVFFSKQSVAAASPRHPLAGRPVLCRGPPWRHPRVFGIKPGGPAGLGPRAGPPGRGPVSGVGHDFAVGVNSPKFKVQSPRL
jgi:hypothetical protein